MRSPWLIRCALFLAKLSSGTGNKALSALRINSPPNSDLPSPLAPTMKISRWVWCSFFNSLNVGNLSKVRSALILLACSLSCAIAILRLDSQVSLLRALSIAFSSAVTPRLANRSSSPLYWLSHLTTLVNLVGCESVGKCLFSALLTALTALALVSLSNSVVD